MVGIMTESNLDTKIGITQEELQMALGRSEHLRRKSWFDYEQGNLKATFSKESFEKYWPEEMKTPFSKLSLGLQYWDLNEVRKRLEIIKEIQQNREVTEEQKEYLDALVYELNLIMQIRNPEPSMGGSYDMYNKYEKDLIITASAKDLEIVSAKVPDAEIKEVETAFIDEQIKQQTIKQEENTK